MDWKEVLQMAVLSTILVTCQASEITLHFKFIEFKNPEGEGRNGHCCDGRGIICHGQCDHRFTFCLDEPERSSDSFTSCRFINYVSGTYYNENDIFFGNDIGARDNHFSQDFSLTDTRARQTSMIHHLAKLKVLVKDVDDFTGDDLVAKLHYDVLITEVDIRVKEPWVHEMVDGDKSLLAEFWLTCTENWYGSLCDQECIPPSSPAGGHYTCDPISGDKICEPGWIGSDCRYHEDDTTRRPRTTSTSSTTTTPPETPPAFADRPNADCDRLAMNGNAYQDGIYTIHPGDLQPFPVYCDMSAEGWTVIQRRVDGETNFYRGWEDYKRGFGEPGLRTNYWMGLEKLYHLTNMRSYSLRITMRLGNLGFRYAEYRHFWIESEGNQYRLHVIKNRDTGTAGDALIYTGEDGKLIHDGMPFTTHDRDNDNNDSGNCAELYQSGWWFNDCYYANLNGPYVDQTSGWPACTRGRCIAWNSIDSYEGYSLIYSEMKILPNPRY